MKKILKVLFAICFVFIGLQMHVLTARAEIVAVTEGSYTLRNVGTGKYLNVYGNKNANNINIDVFSKDNTNGQDFKIYKYGDSYALSPLCSSNGRVVNVYSEKAQSGNNVCLWSRTNHSTQLWKFDKVSGGYIIRCANNTKCVLNATGSKNNANVNITTYKSGNKNQIWVLESPATTTNAATSTLKIASVSSPSTITQGNAFSIKGVITSNYKLNSVTGQILKSDGTSVIYGKTVNPNAKSYSLYNSSVDVALLFNKLGAGTYYYKVSAKDVSGKSLVFVNTTFTVKSKAATTVNATTEAAKTQTTTATKTEKTTNPVTTVNNKVKTTVDNGVKNTSKLKISGVKYPTTIYVGNAFTIEGKITSNYKITKVTGEIIKVGAKKASYVKTVEPKKTSYSLKNGKIDTALLFNKLGTGEYYYKITATDAIGNTLTLVNQKFVVKQITFIWPVQSGRVSQEYGKKSHYDKSHRGIDITDSGKVNIYAAGKGKVLKIVTGKKKDRNTKGMATYGNYVIIRHDNGYVTLYAHLKNVKVSKGATVEAGKVIGTMGESGNSTGQHLHFEVIKGKEFGNNTVDPSKFNYKTKKGASIKGTSIKRNFSTK